MSLIKVKIGGHDIKHENQPKEGNLVSFIARKLLVKTHESIIMINIKEIGYLCAEGSYCQIHLIDGRYIMCSKPMSFYYDKLREVQHFVRVHHSYVVNLDYVKELHHEQGILLRHFSICIPVSRRKKGEIKSILESWSV